MKLRQLLPFAPAAALTFLAWEAFQHWEFRYLDGHLAIMPLHHRVGFTAAILMFSLVLTFAAVDEE